MEDMFVQLRESTIHSQVGHIQVYKTGYYSQGRRDPYHYLIQNPDLLAQQLSKLPHVKKVMERIQFSATLNNTQADLPVQGEGVEADKESELGGAVTWSEGRALTDGDAYGIVLGEGVARALQLQPGDYATLLVSAPGGVLNSLDFKVVGVFHTLSKDYDDHAVRILLPAAQDLLAVQGVHSLVLLLDDTLATTDVAAALKSRLPADEYEVKTWLELTDFYGKTVKLYTNYFGVMKLIISVMVFEVCSTASPLRCMSAPGNLARSWRSAIAAAVYFG